VILSNILNRDDINDIWYYFNATSLLLHLMLVI